MLKAIFIDVDNTLIVTEPLYDRARAMMNGYMANFGVRAEEVEKVFLQKDRELFRTMGYSRERYPASFESTLRHFVPEAGAEMVKIVRDFGETIFRTVPSIMPGAEEALDLFTQMVPVYIVTAGPESVQKFRVDNLPFKDKFAGVHIVDHKDKAIFDGILKRRGLKPDEVAMIGDSLKSDVLAAADAGLHAVWIAAHNSQHEKVGTLPALPQKAHKFSSLLEAAHNFARHGEFRDIPMPLPKFKRAPKP